MKLSAEVFDLKDLATPAFSFAGITGGSVGVVLGMIYGDATINVMAALLLFSIVGLDWAGAIAAAIKDGTYSSEYGKVGIIRTVVILVLPVIGRLMDLVIGTPNVAFLFITGGLIYHNFMSMTANFARAGFEKWIPNKMLQAVASEIEAKITRSEGRREAISPNQIETSSLTPATPVAPIDTPENPLMNSDSNQDTQKAE